jgi:hypothetical protein
LDLLWAAEKGGREYSLTPSCDGTAKSFWIFQPSAFARDVPSFTKSDRELLV